MYFRNLPNPMHCFERYILPFIQLLLSSLFFLILNGCANLDAISLDKISLDKITLPKLPSFKLGADEQWPSYGKNLTNQRFSSLMQINESNVKNLELAWKFKTGVAAKIGRAHV